MTLAKLPQIERGNLSFPLSATLSSSILSVSSLHFLNFLVILHDHGILDL